VRRPTTKSGLAAATLAFVTIMTFLVLAPGSAARAQAPSDAEARHPPSLGSVWVPGATVTPATRRRSGDREIAPGAWGITDDQWDRFKAYAIANGLRLTVSVRLNTLRARNFKDDLVDLLSSIPGWEVDDQGTYTAGTLASFDGILIQNASALDPTPEARAVMAAFEAAAILPMPVYEAWEPGRIRIVVGAPP
jgi:hypothetical protein